jgi:prevent-host-death family protein
MESSMASPVSSKNGAIVVSALRARASFGKLLQRLENDRQSLVIEKRGRPRAVLISIQEYVKLASPEPEVLRVIGEESERNKTNMVTGRQIDRIIQATRQTKNKRR